METVDPQTAPKLEFSFTPVEHYGKVIVNGEAVTHRILEQRVTYGTPPPEFPKFIAHCERETGLINLKTKEPIMDVDDILVPGDTIEEAWLNVDRVYNEWEEQSKHKVQQAMLSAKAPPGFDPKKPMSHQMKRAAQNGNMRIG